MEVFVRMEGLGRGPGKEETLMLGASLVMDTFG
jgi:hypothetical protein